MDIKEEKVPKTIEELRECCDHIEVTVPVMFHGEACPQCGIYKEKKTGEYVVYFGMPSGGAYSANRPLLPNGPRQKSPGQKRRKNRHSQSITFLPKSAVPNTY